MPTFLDIWDIFSFTEVAGVISDDKYIQKSGETVIICQQGKECLGQMLNPSAGAEFFASLKRKS